MSQRVSFLTPYVAAARQSTGKAWRTITGQFTRAGFGNTRPKPFSPAKLGLRLGDQDKCEAFLKGKFHYGGQSLDVGLQGDPWTVNVPSTRYATWLHGFSWLEDMAGVKGEYGAIRARILVDSWITHYGQWNDFAWSPDVLAERLFNWLAFWAPALNSDSNKPNAERRRASVMRQAKALRSAYKRTTPGLPRLMAAAALALTGARNLDGGAPLLARGLDWLDEEIDTQILPDGGHISRSPAQTFAALKTLFTLDQILQERGVEGSRAMSRAIDRLGPVIAFFQHTDEALAGFHGGDEGNAAQIKQLLAAIPGASKPFGYCPHTGYQRLTQGKTVLIVDTGSAPPTPYDSQTHLAPLAFELSTHTGRLVVGCGWNNAQPAAWRRPIRSAAAHSTLVIDDRSPGALLPEGWKSRVMGDIVATDTGPAKATRKEQESGIWLEAFHEGYRAEHGLAHRRRFYMAQDGNDIRGEDCLYLPLGAAPISRDDVPFDIRFHLHPDVRVSLSQDQASALLVQGGKSGWRFRSDGGPLRIEDSVYLGAGHKPVKSKQLVISGRAFCDSDGETRSNRVRWSFRELRGRES